MMLEVSFGKMPNGEAVVRDLVEMPNLLIGGVTGSGKSGFLHSLVCSLVQSHSPEQVRFALIDPKWVEFGGYAKLPHLYSPVVYEIGQGMTVLEHIETEMDRRFALFSAKGSHTIADFNKTDEGASLPYIIVVIDEFSDFMTLTDGAFESFVSRIAVKGRASGVHLVMATSRLGAVFDDLKASVPERLAFRVCQEADSRTLLDECGAEALLKRGDALLKDRNGTAIRLQPPYIRDEEVPQIVDSTIARFVI